MPKRIRTVTLLFALALGAALPAMAHFGMAIPSASTVEKAEDGSLRVEISFGHPMAGVGMHMARPRSVKLFRDGQAEDLAPALEAARVMDHDAWRLNYEIKRPGVYAFAVEPEPYWEAAEDIFIVHHTKTYVAAFGADGGWDEPLGLKTEIVPLTRPFGNYAGNVFRGRVLKDGRPVAHAEVEVEHYNREGRRVAPNGYFTTQTVKADADGVFAYGVPFAGWWGFAALGEADDTIERDGRARTVELGAVLWAEFVDSRVISHTRNR